MGQPGDCRICRSGHRDDIAASHARGEPVRSIARRLGLPEASTRRHLAKCKPRPPRANVKAGLVTRAHLEAVAKEFKVPFREVLRHHVLCRGGDVVTTSDEEAHELCEMAGLFQEGTPCCAGGEPCR